METCPNTVRKQHHGCEKNLQPLLQLRPFPTLPFPSNLCLNARLPSVVFENRLDLVLHALAFVFGPEGCAWDLLQQVSFD
jgi:hypothetical protein